MLYYKPVSDLLTMMLPREVAGVVRITCARSIEEAQEPWAELEESAIHTAYQTRRWIKAAMNWLPDHAEPLIVWGENAQGVPLFLLPLHIVNRHGQRMARFMGGKHANFAMGLYAHDFQKRADMPAMQTILQAIADLAPGGIDIYAFQNQPRSWHGFANPLVLFPSQDSPSDAYGVTLDPDPEIVFMRAQSAHARKRLKKKLAGMSKLGKVEMIQPSSRAEAEQLVDRFIVWKTERLAAGGIENVFLEPGARDFLLMLASDGLDDGSQAMQMFALMLDDEPIAVFGATVGSGQLCGMVNSIGNGPFLTHSPGDLLIIMMIRAACMKGLKTLDLGVGEARYKTSLCDLHIMLADTWVPMTRRGRMLDFILRRAFWLKGYIKNNPRLWKLASDLRQYKAMLTGRR